jgi:membrane protein DedA with SNARE-associated domain
MLEAANWGYWGIFLLMMLENVIPPVPSEAIMSMAGIAVSQGKMNFLAVLLTGTAGTVIGNLFWWEIGRRLGYERLRPLVERWGRWLTLEWEDIEKLRRYFDRWGGVTVFLFRFMPLGRTVISIPAGLMHMPFWRFVLFTAAGSAIWNVLLIGVGMGLHAGIAGIERYVGPAVIGFVVLALAGYVYRILTWKPRAQR